MIIFFCIPTVAYTQFGKGLVLDGCSNYLEVNASTVYSGQTEPPIPVETEPLCFVI